MCLCGFGARGDVKHRNCGNFSEERLISRKGQVFGKPIWFDFKVCIFRNESMFCELFPKKTISILNIYLYDLWGVSDKYHFGFNLVPFPEKYTQNITLAYSDVFIFYAYDAINHVPWILL